MTLGELLQYLDQHTEYQLLDGSPAETLDKARESSHQDPLAAEIISAMMDKTGLSSPDESLERADAVNSLGPVRLKYMADDAPVEGFRMVEKLITAIDAAYNEEALAQRGKA